MKPNKVGTTAQPTQPIQGTSKEESTLSATTNGRKVSKPSEDASRNKRVKAREIKNQQRIEENEANEAKKKLDERNVSKRKADNDLSDANSSPFKKVARSDETPKASFNHSANGAFKNLENKQTEKNASTDNAENDMETETPFQPSYITDNRVKELVPDTLLELTAKVNHGFVQDNSEKEDNSQQDADMPLNLSVRHGKNNEDASLSAPTPDTENTMQAKTATPDTEIVVLEAETDTEDDMPEAVRIAMQEAETDTEDDMPEAETATASTDEGNQDARNSETNAPQTEPMNLTNNSNLRANENNTNTNENNTNNRGFIRSVFDRSVQIAETVINHRGAIGGGLFGAATIGGAIAAGPVTATTAVLMWTGGTLALSRAVTRAADAGRNAANRLCPASTESHAPESS